MKSVCRVALGKYVIYYAHVIFYTYVCSLMLTYCTHKYEGSRGCSAHACCVLRCVCALDLCALPVRTLGLVYAALSY